MKNLLVCTLLFASAFTLNAQVANTRIYAAEKLAKVKESQFTSICPCRQNSFKRCRQGFEDDSAVRNGQNNDSR